MPLLQEYVTSLRSARDLVVTVLTDAVENGDIELGYVGRDDERRLPNYPAVVVSAGGKTREIHGTHTFSLALTCTIWVYHGNLGVGHATRSDEDIELAETIESLIQTDPTFNGAFIFSYIEAAHPGFFQPRASKGDLIVGTRLLWGALSQERFK